MMKGWPPGPIKYGKAMMLCTKNKRISKFGKIFMIFAPNVKNKTIKIDDNIILKNGIILTEILLTSKSNRICVYCKVMTSFYFRLIPVWFCYGEQRFRYFAMMYDLFQAICVKHVFKHVFHPTILTLPFIFPVF